MTHKITLPENQDPLLSNSREEIKTLEFKIRSQESSVSALKDQIRYLRLQNKDAEDAREEAKKLHKQLEILKRYLIYTSTYN